MLIKFLDHFNLTQIADSGQCFRMNGLDGQYTAVHNGHFVQAIQKDREVCFSCSETEFENIWKEYFDLDTDYGRFQDSAAGDPFLEKAAEFGKGIRILKQDPWEMVCSFIISQNRNIPAIKKSIEALCRLFGDEIPGTVSCFSFPSAARLNSLSASEMELFRTQASLGYRDKFILKAAADVAEGCIDLDALKQLSNEDLYQTLLSMHGVGPKVANCIMLFGFHRIDAFPIDLWIKRILAEIYHNNFDADKHSGFKGVIQQYMFYYYRSHYKKT